MRESARHLATADHPFVVRPRPRFARRDPSSDAPRRSLRSRRPEAPGGKPVNAVDPASADPALALGHVSGLRTLLPLNDLELDLVAFRQRLETIALDGAEVHEHVRSTFVRNEAVALRVEI